MASVVLDAMWFVRYMNPGAVRKSPWLLTNIPGETAMAGVIFQQMRDARSIRQLIDCHHGDGQPCRRSMTIRIAINGFGRIGRNVVRALYESGRRLIDCHHGDFRTAPGFI
jgi:phosphoglycerate dehydrogenase-like enzyme